jgi:hypothetical protein
MTNVADFNAVRAAREIAAEGTRGLPPESSVVISAGMTPGEIDAKIAASEARTGERFAQLRGDFFREFEALRGDLKEVRASLVPLAGLKSTVVVTGVTSVLAMAAIVIGILAYGGDRFGAGADIGGIIDKAATRAVEQALPRQSLGVVDSKPTAVEPGQ